MANNTQHLTRLQGICYSLPMLAFGFLVSPAGFMLQGIYAKHFGIALTTIATVLLIGRLFDAISDPIIGYCSDRYYARYGSHKPFIIVGSLLFIISCWFLYVPFGIDPAQGQARVSTVYFLLCLLGFYLTQTLLEIAHLAWGSKLTSSAQDNNSVYGLRAVLGLLGVLPFYAIPLLPWFESTEFTPQVLQWSAVIGGSLMLVMLYLCVRYTPNQLASPANETQQPGQREKARVVLASIVGNSPLLVLTAAHICTGLGSGMLVSLLYIFIDAYLGLGAKFAAIFLITTCLQLTFVRFWVVLANCWGKQAAWIMGMVLVTLGTLGMGLLSPQATSWITLSLCVVLVFCGFAACAVLIPSLLSDIIDYGTWKFGTNRASTYFSLYCFINKSAAALGAAFALALAGWFGFDPASQSQSDSAITGLRLAMFWIPVLFYVLSMVFIFRIPITARRHAIIRRRLDSRSRRALKTSPGGCQHPVVNDKPTNSHQPHHPSQT